MKWSNTYSLEFLNNYYRDFWWNLNTNADFPFSSVNYFTKINNEKSFNSIIDSIISHIVTFPKDLDKRSSWKEDGLSLLDSILKDQKIFKLNFFDENMKKQFLKSTKDFIIESKKFDSNISYSYIGQALRNVWIVNIFQKALGEEIKFTPAIFGYSMLYPYTDNYLDNINIEFENKVNFNNNFTSKLKGELRYPTNVHEEQVFKLVDHIENVFDRITYPKVYEKLLQIHEAQKKSLTQQDIKSLPYERDILGISIEKGGTSVLADGYLIKGTLTKEEELFAYGYGFFLQLCDDLQDINNDILNNHMTIMSQLAGRYNLDSITNKLINLTINVVNEAECFIGSDKADLKTLIINNCLYMLIFAIISAREYFSKDFIKNISSVLPFTIKYVDKIDVKLKSKFSKLQPSYHGVSLEDIFLYLID